MTTSSGGGGPCNAAPPETHDGQAVRQVAENESPVDPRCASNTAPPPRPHTSPRAVFKSMPYDFSIRAASPVPSPMMPSNICSVPTWLCPLRRASCGETGGRVPRHYRAALGAPPERGPREEEGEGDDAPSAGPALEAGPPFSGTTVSAPTASVRPPLPSNRFATARTATVTAHQPPGEGN